MNYRNAVYNPYGTIDCEVEHPEYGWIPTTLSPDDEGTSSLYNTIKAAPSGTIAPYKILVYQYEGTIRTTWQKFQIPKSVPYISINPSEVPDEPIETWEVDFSDPDGFGTQ